MDTDGADATTIASVKCLLTSYPKHTKYIVELIEPENLQYLELLGCDMSKVVCHNDLCMKLIAMSQNIPGLQTLLFNLIQSSGEVVDSAMDQCDLEYQGKFHTCAMHQVLGGVGIV